LESEKGQANEQCGGGARDEEHAKEPESAWGEQKRARVHERERVKEIEREREPELSLEKRTYELSERKQADGK
jgi:hypothetical protein